MPACEFYKYCLSKGWNRDLILQFIELANKSLFTEQDIVYCHQFINNKERG